MKLVRTTIFSAVITFVRISSGFVAGKIIAIVTGPAGVALIGAFSNFIAIVLIFANGAISNGIVKYTSEYQDNKNKLKSLFSTGLIISLVCAAITGLILIIGSAYWSKLIFTTETYTNVIRVLGFTVIFYSVNSLLLSILNGNGQIKTLTIVNGAGSIIGLIFTSLLVFFYKIEGALYALVLAQSIVFLITAYFLMKSSWFSWDYFKKPFDKLLSIKLGHYSMMAVTSALTVPVSQIILRNLIITALGVSSAGLWQGMMRISDGYLMIITTSLNIYYLPKLASLKTNLEIKKEILNGYKIILPAVLFGCILIYFLRHYVISLLYTPEFLKIETLFLWQLVGDFFKMAAWILSYLLLAKSMTKVFILTEIIFSATYVIFGHYLVSYMNLEGISVAFALNYFLYFLTMLIIFRGIFFKKYE